MNSHFVDESQAQHACDVANAALFELGFDPDHEVEEFDGRWYIGTPAWFVTAPPEIVYRSLILGSLAVGRRTVPCFDHWNRRRLSECGLIPSTHAAGATTPLCGAS